MSVLLCGLSVIYNNVECIQPDVLLDTGCTQAVLSQRQIVIHANVFRHNIKNISIKILSQ